MKQGRRGNNEGTLVAVKDKNGKIIGWKGAVLYTNIETGLTERKWFRGRTREELRQKKDDFRAQVRKFGGLPSQERTVETYLRSWLDERRTHVKPKTMEDYERVVDKRLIPALGPIPLAQLAPLDINRMVAALLREGKAAEARRALARLKMALGDAYRLQLVTHNAAEHVRLPAVETARFGVWQPDQVQTFLEITQDTREYALYCVLLTTGMRSGEVRGLRWQDVDLERGLLRVEQQYVETAKAAGNHFGPPKRDSRRTIRIEPDLVAVLKAHRRRQEDERDTAEDFWQPFDLVFTTVFGTPISASNLAREFKKYVAVTGLPLIRIHDLRDTAASHMLASGAELPLVAEILGHKDSSVTLRKYTHVLERQREGRRLGLGIYGRSPSAKGTADSRSGEDNVVAEEQQD